MLSDYRSLITDDRPFRVFAPSSVVRPLSRRTSQLWRLRLPCGAGKVEAMSTKAQAILDEIRALPPKEFQAVWEQLQRWVSSRRADMAADDPIRSARGMFAGSRLTEALLASRAEDCRRG